jgi:hypothetical protein
MALKMKSQCKIRFITTEQYTYFGENPNSFKPKFKKKILKKFLNSQV